MNTEHTFPELHAANSNNGRIFKSWRIYAEQNNAKPRAVATMESDDLSPEKEMALATLFASAPELLKALEIIRVIATPAPTLPWEQTPPINFAKSMDEIAKQCRAAIAKALGR